MKNKKFIYIIYPESLKTVPINDLSMCELLLNELIFSKNESIKFHVNNKLQLIECNDTNVKKILHKENNHNSILGKLKFLIE